MNDFQKQRRFIVVGTNGGFSSAILKNIRLLHPDSPIINFSSREFNSNHFRNQTSVLSKNQKSFPDNVIWCSGTSSNRSPQSECLKDEFALREFTSIFLEKAKIAPHFSFLSSGGTVYGPSAGVVNELSPINPKTAYADMKIRSENFLQKLAQKGVVSLSIFRLANVYGSIKPGNRMSIVETALKKREIFLTVNSESRKQYGTYDDYASQILFSLKNRQGPHKNIVIQNVFSDHLYSIDDILRLTAAYNMHGENRLVHQPSDSSITETVILTSTQPIAKYGKEWQSLENYLKGISF